MVKGKCWKKFGIHYIKNKGKKNVEGISFVQGGSWLHKDNTMKYIGKGKKNGLKYMKKHDKC